MIGDGLRSDARAVFCFGKPGTPNGAMSKDNIDVMKKLFEDPTRQKHFFYAIPIGAVFTILCVLGVASGMEFKDKQWGGIWDWKDWLCTMLGGLVGQVLQIILILILCAN